MSNKEDLPSINEYLEDSNLPSYKDFIEEKHQLPSVEDYTSKSSKEEILVEETVKDIGHVLSETTPEWTELVRLVNDLRKEIPEIPEIKYYDEELSNLSNKLTHIEDYFTQFDQKSNKIDDLDVKNEHLEEKLTEIESKIPEIPVIRYYDHDISHINDKITQLREDVLSLPEIKHYDSDIASLVEEINKVKSRDVPDFRWIGNTFNTIDEDFTRVQGHLDVIKEKISFEVSELNENIQVNNFEQNVNVKNLKDNISEKIDQTNNQLTETKDKIYSELSKSSLKIWEYHREFKDDDRKLKKAILSEQNKLKQKLEKDITSVNEQSTKTDETLLKFFNELKEEVNSLPEVKYYDNELSSITKDIDSLKVTVSELRGIASLIKKDQKQLQENYLLNEPPSVKEKTGGQTDPLTPLDQKFATLDDLSNHYRLFINRITTQLSTMGGGGAGFLKDLDDVSFDQTTGTNKLLIYNGSKWVGIASTAISGETTNISIAGSITAAEGFFSGNLSVGGTITYDDVTHVDSLGLSTFRSGIEVNTGTATTALLVRGDARITGILTIGTASITIDGDTETITTGIVTITNSQVNIGSNVVINSGATGINSAPNVFYVAKDGNDTNNGTSIDNAKLTIAAAVGVANSGSTIKVLSGNYVEQNPIEVPAFISIVGDDQRAVKVLPNTTNKDLFHVRKGVKLASMTFSGHTAPAAAVGFPTTEIAENVGGGKWKGPYIQNCTSDTTTGVGIRIDGKQARSLKSMNVDSFTQYNQGGVGVAVTNGGFAQLVSVFTICCDEAISCDAGGQADLANSNCSFGTKGLVSRGTGALQFTGSVSSSAAISQDNVTVNLSTPTLNISNFQYTHQTGVATVTTTADHNFSVGMGVTLAGIAVTCGAGRSEHTFVSGITSAITANTSAKYTASSGTTYDPLTGVMVIGIGSHSLTTSNTITIDNGGLTFTCDADSNATEHVYPRATDPISGISTAITAVSATTITVNVGAVGSQTKTYPYQNPYVFEVDETPTVRKFVINVGVSKHIHNYVSGGTVKVDIDRPYDGQVAYFDTLYKTVQSITVDSGGTGYTSTPEVTIDNSPTGETATAFATLEGNSVSSITIISSGNQYTSTPSVTISGGGGSGASATANMSSIYYTINSSTPVVSGISTLTLDTNLLNTVGVGSTVYFFQQSKIIASSHTFEYVGTGNNITSATPKRGGVTIQTNEVVSQNGGKVIYTSTDQAGNFRIGDDLQINQNTGTISGRAFSKSLFSEITPFILALS
jgi:hypothetical protein